MSNKRALWEVDTEPISSPNKRQRIDEMPILSQPPDLDEFDDPPTETDEQMAAMHTRIMELEKFQHLHELDQKTIQSLEEETKLQQHALIGDIEVTRKGNNTHMDLSEQGFQPLTIIDAAPQILSNRYKFPFKMVEEDADQNKASHSHKRIDRIALSVQKEMRLVVELRWKQAICVDDDHFCGDDHDDHKGKFDKSKGCSIEYCSYMGTGILISTYPYFVVLTAAHNTQGFESASPQFPNQDYIMNWCPWSDQVYQIPLHFVKIHPNYHDFTCDPAADIAIMIGKRDSLPASIKTLDPIKMYQINLQSFENSSANHQYYFEGYTPRMRNDNKVFFYRADAQIVDNTLCLYQFITKVDPSIDIVEYRGNCIEFEGDGEEGFSGGPLWAEHKINGKKSVIGLQSIGYEKKKATDLDWGTACKLNEEKIDFIVSNIPCVFRQYKCDNCNYLSVFD